MLGRWADGSGGFFHDGVSHTITIMIVMELIITAGSMCVDTGGDDAWTMMTFERNVVFVVVVVAIAIG